MMFMYSSSSLLLRDVGFVKKMDGTSCFSERLIFGVSEIESRAGTVRVCCRQSAALVAAGPRRLSVPHMTRIGWFSPVRRRMREVRCAGKLRQIFAVISEACHNAPDCGPPADGLGRMPHCWRFGTLHGRAAEPRCRKRFGGHRRSLLSWSAARCHLVASLGGHATQPGSPAERAAERGPPPPPPGRPALFAQPVTGRDTGASECGGGPRSGRVAMTTGGAAGKGDCLFVEVALFSFSEFIRKISDVEYCNFLENTR